MMSEISSGKSVEIMAISNRFDSCAAFGWQARLQLLERLRQQPQPERLLTAQKKGDDVVSGNRRRGLPRRKA
jgi:hypothetical protein